MHDATVTSPTWAARPCLALLLLVASADAQLGLDDFTWTLVGTSQGPNTQDATSIHVESLANSSCVDELVYFEATAPVTGTVSARLDWNILDFCHYDWPVFVVDGVHTKVEIAFGGSCYQPGTEFVSFDVPAGSTFGLGAGSSDCFDGQGIADWTEFAFTPTAWIDLGQALGPPELTATGLPLAGSPFTLDVDDGALDAPLALVLGASDLNAPFKGGVLVPAPDVVVFAATDAAGQFQLAGTWPANIPVSLALWIQVWIENENGPVGWSATNALQTVQP